MDMIFHRPIDGGTRGASEYQDIKAAGEWLAKQPDVDATQIGVYGGYLTAMALGRDSDLFAAGVTFMACMIESMDAWTAINLQVPMKWPQTLTKQLKLPGSHLP